MGLCDHDPPYHDAKASTVGQIWLRMPVLVDRHCQFHRYIVEGVYHEGVSDLQGTIEY
jgi:hypothetical protein